MDLRDRVGANLRKLRRLQSLSQEALSLKAGLERGYVGRLERSQYYTSMATVQKLAFALDVDPIELIEPVLITLGKTSRITDHETFDEQKGPIGTKLLAAPFQEGFENRRGDLTLVLIDYLWNDGSTVRRWLVDPKKVKQSAVVLKPCGEL
ncbi:Helix-turn-helix [Sulfitobacter brevis]|uniref:Helix-turn-helix n=1 Tax=Sulfitobacter brevis TaxID=74348 RepID=A0A1I2F043_9RHOB|nr:helix-turn-helix transcriptional regulator [Sulfitobacter brevis]SFE98333.1 Helix-turn-helix [Sulfitobacter brevis]